VLDCRHAGTCMEGGGMAGSAYQGHTSNMQVCDRSDGS
jgi:hypothetical protein